MASDRDILADLIDAHSFQAPSYSADAADAVIAAGWRPPPQVITTAEELDALPIGATILLERGVVAQAVGGEEDIAALGWMGIGHDLVWTSAQVVEHASVVASFIVLYVPNEANS